MVNDFDKRGMFSNRWLDFSLRQNVYDGRCYRMAKDDPKPRVDQYVNVQRIQKREYIEDVTFEEYTDKDSDLLVSFRWLVATDDALYSIETNNCVLVTSNSSDGSVAKCQVIHAKYERVVITLYRIDGDVTTNQFDWAPTTGTKTTRIGDYVKDFTLTLDDTMTNIITNGGERVILRSDLKFNNADSSTIWNDIIFFTEFNGPEKTNGKLQTNTYYYLHIDKSSSYNAQVSSDEGQVKTASLPSFTLIQHGQSGGTRPVKTTSIIASNDKGFNFYNEEDKADGNDYFAWFKTPVTFERRKKTTPSLRWGNFGDIANQTTTSKPLASDGQVTGVKSNDVLFDVELKATFFYDTLDFDNQNNLRIPDDVPRYVGLSTKNLAVLGADFTEVYSKYVGGSQYTDYVQKLPSGLGGDDPGRHIDISYSFKAPANTQWLYRIWVTKESGETWFANLTTGTNFPYRSSLNPSDLKITTGTFTVDNWVNPSSKSTGFWYQMLQCWKNDTSDLSFATRLSPFMTVLRKATPAVPGFNTKVDGDYPVFYYLNYKFEEDKNYQFRTILENFYTYRSSTNLFRTSADSADLRIITPWGEKLNMDPPFINLATIPTGMKRVNMYLSTNLNAYSIKNNSNIVDTNGSVPTKPIQLISSKSNPQNPITYTAKPYFGGDVLLTDPNNASLVSGLNWVGVLRFDWFIQGGATFNIMNQTTNGKVETKNTEKIPYFLNVEPFGGRGWHYLGDQKKLIWFDKIGNPSILSGLMTELNSNFPVGGDPGDYFANKTSDVKYLRNNFVATYIPYQSFNVSFDYVNESPFGISMYLGGNLPFAKEGEQFWKTDIDELITQGLVKLVGKLGLSKGSPQKCKFIGLVGNQYLFFVADNVIKFGSEEKVNDLFVKVGNTYKFESKITGFPLNTDSNDNGYSTYSVISLDNFTFAGAYNDGNNRVYLTDANLSAVLVNATYSIDLGTGNNVFPNSANTTITTKSKAGNGSFAGGTWENGVWNSGWREDITVAEFNTVNQSFFYNMARIWRMSIGGRPSSVAKFSVGDVVSISNVVAIDINDNRKLLNKSYTVLSIDETSITVETETNFPIKRIEKDSEEHRILVSKNLWLSGVFLNGYFNGIWNNGLFSGYPFITKMDQSHWIDGIFNGGQFVADKIKSNFSTSKTYLLDGTPRLALNFTRPHGMETNDTISITYSNNFLKVDSLGTTTILATPDPLTLVTGIAYDNKYKNVKNGTVNNTTSTGLIQNFDFYSNNASKVTSLDTMKSSRVFTYNSWIDVNYSNKSAVNIGRPQTFIEPQTERSYSENNLYGYPTNDVLSSNSVFRDSFAVTSRRYRLGRKYNIINDFVGASSAFEQAFGPTDTVDGLESFKNQGWDVSKFLPSKSKIQATQADWEFIQGPDDYLLVVEFNYNVLIDNLKEGDDITIVGSKAQWTVANLLVNFANSDIVSEKTIIISKTIEGGKFKIVTDITGSTLIYRWVEILPIYIEFDSINDIVINRTSDPVTTNTPLIGKEMKSIVKGKGGVVNLIPVDDINGRTNGKDSETLGRLRYTMVEFEVADFKTTGNTTFYDDSDIKSAPPLHFNNLNYVSRLARDGNGQKVLRKIEASYLPIYRNVNHVSTPGRKKQEFFFNKRNLLMNMSGSGFGGIFNNEIYLDNLKFYEVDMIPFFQYFKSPIGKSGNINISVQIPNTGISPTIQPTEDFIDATAGNDVVNEFAEKFIASNVQVPKNVNWRADYAVYRTQQQDLTGNPGLYGGN